MASTHYIKAKVITGNGADHCEIEVNLPNPCWPYTGRLWISFAAAADTGADYIRRHYNLKAEVIARAA